MLRALVVIVQNVVSTFQMKRNHPPPDWRTGPAEALLPRMKTDTQQQETNSAIQHDGPSALILSSTQSVRPSKGEPSVCEADELVRWTNSCGERPKRKRRAGMLTTASSTPAHPWTALLP